MLVKNKIYSVFKIVFVIIGTLIGAGFASGQEIYSFFGIYGAKGLIGILISTLLMCAIIYKTLKIIKENNIKSYKELIKKIFERKCKNEILKNSIVAIVNIFLLISFYIMVAGFSMYFYQELGINKIYGAIFIVLLLLITFSKNIDGVIKINTLLIPFLIILFVVLGFKKIDTFELLRTDYNFKWLISGILYASYNSIVLIPILIDLKKHIASEKMISIISGILILILSSLIYFILYSNINDIKGIEIPIVHIAGSMGMFSKIIYGIVVLIAIFTSAVSAGYGFLVNITKSKRSYVICSMVICLSAILISQMGFSNLINLMYPIFGVLGIIQIVFLLTTWKKYTVLI